MQTFYYLSSLNISLDMFYLLNIQFQYILNCLGNFIDFQDLAIQFKVNEYISLDLFFPLELVCMSV